MILRETHSSLLCVCRAVERKTSTIGVLSALDVKVELLSSFDNEPDAQITQTIRNNPAAYSKHRGWILVNGRCFFKLPNNLQEIVLIHEAGHAYLHLVNSAYREKPRFATLNEDYIVDLLLCRWGFKEELIIERAESYGKEYCDALHLWSDETKYIEAMHLHHMKKLVGIP